MDLLSVERCPIGLSGNQLIQNLYSLKGKSLIFRAHRNLFSLLLQQKFEDQFFQGAKADQAKADKVSVAAGCPASTKTTVNNLTWPTAPAMTIDKAKTYLATITTDLGPFVVTLNAASAPTTVNNFVFLAQKGYYHCVIFHRVIPGFMDQTGDPTGTGTGGPGYTITDENPPKASNPAQQYPLGSVAMANTGSANSGGSQFFIVAGSQGESLPNTYALFGQVTSGLSIVNTINAQGSTANNGVPPLVTHRILSITIATQ